ncbi:MAG: hypothetical protein WC949_00070 [Candidatus Paceibacterota bacterium]|jgi:hypothetical protein
MPFPKPSSRALAVISSAIVLSLSAGYIALAWTEPVGTMPVTVAAPLNTGDAAQTKTGALAITGSLTAPIFYDADDPASTYYVNPSGQTVLAGPVGVGTTIPYSALNVAGSGANISNKGIIVGTVGDSISTNVPLYGETGRFEIGFPGWRDVEPLQIGAKIAAIRKNVYQPNSALVQGTDIAFYTGAGSTGNNPAFHDTSSEKMRITYDGKVVIDNGGQLCIGDSCVNSTAWNTIVNNASGGGNTFTAAPTTIFSDGFEDGALSPFTSSRSVSCLSLFTPTTASQYSGSYSAYSGPINCGSGAQYIDLNFPATYTIGPGGGTLSFMARGYLGTSGDFGPVNNGGDGNIKKIGSASVNGNWQKFTYYLSEGIYILKLRFLYCYGCWGNSGTGVYVDDIEIQQSQVAITINGNISLNGNLINNNGDLNCYPAIGSGGRNTIIYSCKTGDYISSVVGGTGSVGTQGLQGATCCSP